MEATEEGLTVLICSECGVNPIEVENLDSETCSCCLEEQGRDSLNMKELNFDTETHRKDDRQGLDSIEIEDDYEY